MRVIRTFIVRLLADDAMPDALRGLVRPVADVRDYRFADAVELAALLHRLCFEEIASRSSGEDPGGDKDED